MNNEYLTKDLAEAAALVVKGQQPVRIERKGSTCWFVFDNCQKCEEFSSEFFFGALAVNAREYYEALNRLKNRIFAKTT